MHVSLSTDNRNVLENGVLEIFFIYLKCIKKSPADTKYTQYQQESQEGIAEIGRASCRERV